MNKVMLLIILLSLQGCATNSLANLDAEQQQRLTQLIDNIAARQQVGHSSAVPELFAAPFDLNTQTLLADPRLMPALMQVKARHVTMFIEIKPDAEQLQVLTHGIRLSAGLQEFLIAQQFVVERRLTPHASSNQIRIEFAAKRSH